MDTKRCGRCNTMKPTFEFGTNRHKKDGLQERCRSCRSDHASAHSLANKERSARWQAQNQERTRAYQQKKYQQNAEKMKSRARERGKTEKKRAEDRRWRLENRERARYRSIRSQAYRRKIVFTLTWERFLILRSSTHCPICGVEMTADSSKTNPRNKSIDRVDSGGPYSDGNCACICCRCNMLKGQATAAELQRIAAWIEAISNELVVHSTSKVVERTGVVDLAVDF